MAQETWKDYKHTKHSRPLPLKGIRVLEVCTLILGPVGPGYAAAMGAEVIPSPSCVGEVPVSLNQAF